MHFCYYYDGWRPAISDSKGNFYRVRSNGGLQKVTMPLSSILKKIVKWNTPTLKYEK